VGLGVIGGGCWGLGGVIWCGGGWWGLGVCGGGCGGWFVVCWGVANQATTTKKGKKRRNYKGSGMVQFQFVGEVGFFEKATTSR